MNGADGSTLCKIHAGKTIEYFCKQCNVLVCARCMFESHNGHDLASLESASQIVKQNVTELAGVIEAAKSITTANHDAVQ